MAARGSDAGDAASRPVLRVLRTRGPLFVCEDPAGLLRRLPQTRKRHHRGACLSIEELEHVARAAEVVWLRPEDALRRAELRERHASACRLYHHLTDVAGLRLRHGSQFGAAFVGYRDLRGHGACLVFLGPLARPAAVAAARVAGSVAKEAWVAEELHGGGGGFTLTRLGETRGEPRAKRCRGVP
ncbi:uncharacterized protein Tco025E_08665 [Trypanosoma conorhini]|uniref:tRNA intron endonuclease catalytic domain-containing protein n=1 Tax=Trypanosoma conorhini TaxID=83891 RepID=A0A422N6H0_9TRYP|nr:uncharacterized protein Tco025E_08665 [Trypanosoma conorhini]RNF01049.1 hypothetical protein Tco025E_08665 [Trypanosoma conorhini]